MIDWSARARSYLAQVAALATDETDETRVLSVSSVRSEGFQQDGAGVSSVSSASPAEVSSLLASSAPEAANDSNPAGGVVRAQQAGNPYLTTQQGDECHFGGWDDNEIDLFTARAARFAAAGRQDAEHLAERLALRDRQGDDRRMCLECQQLERTGRCAAARHGAIAGADRRMEPIQNILTRCEAFRIPVSAHTFNIGK